MTSNDQPADFQPPTLREVLDRGEPLENYVSLHMFAENVILAPKTRAPRAYRHSIVRFGQMLRDPNESRDAAGMPANDNRDRQMIAENAWQLEVCDNPDLLPRVRAALGELLVRDYERQARERKGMYTLDVGMPERDWECEACGALYDVGDAEAVMIDNPPPGDPAGGDLPHGLYYCRSCVEMAASAFQREHSLN